MATPEAKVKTACKRVLQDFGIHYFMPMQNGYGIVGVSDIICCWNGWYLAIETKAPGKKANTTANQRNFLSNIQKNGGLALVIDDAQELRTILMDILNLRKEQANGNPEETGSESEAQGEVEEPEGEAQLPEGVRPGSVESRKKEIQGRAQQEKSGKPEGWID